MRSSTVTEMMKKCPDDVLRNLDSYIPGKIEPMVSHLLTTVLQ
jgi:hypothetical protein